MLSLKNSLAVLRKTNALLDGHFVLSSGLHSPSYVQCAKLLSFPHKAEKFTKSLASKIKKTFKNIDLILSPAMGGIVIGYEIGRVLKKETRVLIIEDVITTGKSSLECAKLIKKSGAILLGFACLIDRSNKQTLKIKRKKIISQVKLKIPTFKEKNIPESLKKIPITKPGSRFLK